LTYRNLDGRGRPGFVGICRLKRGAASPWPRARPLLRPHHRSGRRLHPGL